MTSLEIVPPKQTTMKDCFSCTKSTNIPWLPNQRPKLDSQSCRIYLLIWNINSVRGRPAMARDLNPQCTC